MPLSTWLASALLAAGAAAEQGERPRAPDGQPGLGEETPQRELLEMLRESRAGSRAFLSELLGLASEVRLLVAGATESYRAAGYFALVGEQGGLEELLAALRVAQSDPVLALSAGGARSKVLASALLDTRLWVRAKVAEGLELDAREVRAGVEVLRGADQGYVQISEVDSQAIARRVDLAASRLRARRSDLLALRPRPAARAAANGASGNGSEALLAAARAEDVEQGRAAVGRVLEAERGRAAQMWGALACARLAQRTAETLAWRERALAEAARLRSEALTYLPDTLEGRAAPLEIASMRKHERVRWAGFRAREGLAGDPLDDVLAYVAAHAADFQWGSLESRPLYDRFLVLRGIRHYDHRTLQGRKLDAWEEEALLAVQRAFERPPPAREGDAGSRGGRR